MKKRLIVTLIICMVVGYYAYRIYTYYAPPTEYQPYIIHQRHDDTLRIAYLGDSWAFMHQEYDRQLEKKLKDILQRPVAVHSFGICGITSKEFYESLKSNANLKFFLQSIKFDFCIISLGINDTYKKMSTVYYQKSIDYTIRFFIANHISPIIIEIPDYDIIKSFEKQSKTRKLIRYMSMYINNTPIDCKPLFRNALNDMLLDNIYNKKINIIRYESWNGNGNKDLKAIYIRDGMHLNKRGYYKLDSCITDIIISTIQK